MNIILLELNSLNFFVFFGWNLFPRSTKNCKRGKKTNGNWELLGKKDATKYSMQLAMKSELIWITMHDLYWMNQYL